MAKVCKNSINPSNHVDDAKKLHSWKAIAKHSGYSKRMLQNFERDGLKIHRKQHGQKVRVWAFEKEVTAFIYQHQNQQRKRKNTPGPREKGITWLRRSWPLIILSLVLAMLGILNRNPVVNKPEHINDQAAVSDISSYHCVMDSFDNLHRLDLLDQAGQMRRTAWSVSTKVGVPPRIRTKYHIRDMIALSSNTLQPRILLECLDNIPRFHNLTEGREVPLPDLSVTTELGEALNKTIVVNTVDWVETEIFTGWLLGANCKGLFLGCIFLLESNLKKPVLRGVLFHPGNISSVLAIGSKVIVSGVLNAREKEFGPYVPALFRIDLEHFLDTKKQLKPFSEKTIPTKERRDYYQLAGVPVSEPDGYISFSPLSKGFPKLINWPGGFETIFQQGTKQEMRFIFDNNLNYRTKMIDEHTPNLDLQLDQIYRGVRFRYWNKDQWGHWLGE